MNIFSALKEALGSLSANKLRSSLTILGIVIGVAAVIAMVSLGRGLQVSINSQLSGIGTTQLSVFYMPDPEIRNPQPLTTGDMQALVDPDQRAGCQSRFRFYFWRRYGFFRQQEQLRHCLRHHRQLRRTQQP